MSQLHGKQLRSTSVDLEKLSGTGSVSFSSGATLTFTEGSTLTRPTNDISQNTDIVNKEYVDSVATGLDVKDAARVISTGNITLSGEQTIDGISVVSGDRVLVAGQNDAKENGIYVADSSGWTRAEDMDEASEVVGGEFLFVKEGTTYADTGWVVSSPDSEMGSIGDSNITFTQFSSAGVINAGDGLSKDGNTLDVNTGTGLEIDGSNDVKLADTAVGAGSYGDAGTVGTFTVDAQGRLTAAGDTSINITSSQVSDFDGASEDAIFTTANFVDSDSLDFTVTTGDSVTAEVIGGTAIGVDNGVYVKIDNDTITIDGNGNLQVDSSAVVPDVSNGLSISSGDIVLGGTLSQNTTIDGDDNNLSFNNIGDFNLTSDSFIYTDTSGSSGIRYDASGYVTDARSLTDKEYVDDKYTAGDGLTLNTGTNNEFSLDANIAGTGLTYSNGVLDVLAGSAQPVYKRETGQTASIGSTTQIATLASTPNEFSRVEVYINGLKVVAQGTVGQLQGNVQDAHVTVDGTVVSWLGESYGIEATDVIEIVYES